MQDKAIKTYLAKCAKSDGSISYDTIKNTRQAAYHYLQFTKAPITDHAIYDMVQFKKSHREDQTHEENLAIFQSLQPVSSHRNYTSSILGIFHRNRAQLDMSIHISSHHKTIPISEPILRAIRQDPELTQIHYDAIDLMAFGGERFTALHTIDLKDIYLVENSTSAIFDIPVRLAKSGINHPSIIPRQLAERLLERAQKLGYKCPMPNYQSVWKTITKLAQRKYNVRLTSHYWRKRFESIAETIPADKMNPNHWIILLGEKPKVGHMPDIYSLMTNQQVINEYEQYLAPRLNLTKDNATAKPSEIEQLRTENNELRERLDNITKLLSQIANKS